MYWCCNRLVLVPCFQLVVLLFRPCTVCLLLVSFLILSVNTVMHHFSELKQLYLSYIAAAFAESFDNMSKWAQTGVHVCCGTLLYIYIPIQ